MIKRNPTRAVRIGGGARAGIVIGGGNRIALQSMCATPTTDTAATLAQLLQLRAAGADIIRIAVDNKKDAAALIDMRRESEAAAAAVVSVDLQENYRLAATQHLGVTEAGMPPEGIDKTRIAFEQLLSRGIGDTVRVSLTVRNQDKHQEIDAARQIIADINAGRTRSVVRFNPNKLNLISCPSCSRVENQSFVELAQAVKQRTQYAHDHAITIAVMGCRVNGPGETDDADLGLWCGPNYVNLKRRGVKVGAFKYDRILDELDRELQSMIAGAAA